MSEKDIQTLISANNEIGLHSHTHPPRLSNLNLKQQLYEYKKNKNS